MSHVLYYSRLIALKVVGETDGVQPAGTFQKPIIVVTLGILEVCH